MPGGIHHPPGAGIDAHLRASDLALHAALQQKSERGAVGSPGATASSPRGKAQGSARGTPRGSLRAGQAAALALDAPAAACASPRLSQLGAAGAAERAGSPRRHDDDASSVASGRSGWSSSTALAGSPRFAQPTAARRRMLVPNEGRLQPPSPAQSPRATTARLGARGAERDARVLAGEAAPPPHPYSAHGSPWGGGALDDPLLGMGASATSPMVLPPRPTLSNVAQRRPAPPPPVRVGDMVALGAGPVAEVRFVGPTHFADGEWVGVSTLDRPAGRHSGSVSVAQPDGSVDTRRYFCCEAGRGLFVRRAAIATVLPSRFVGPACPQPASCADAKAATARARQLGLAAESAESAVVSQEERGRRAAAVARRVEADEAAAGRAQRGVALLQHAQAHFAAGQMLRCLELLDKAQRLFDSAPASSSLLSAGGGAPAPSPARAQQGAWRVASVRVGAPARVGTGAGAHTAYELTVCAKHDSGAEAEWDMARCADAALERLEGALRARLPGKPSARLSFPPKWVEGEARRAQLELWLGWLTARVDGGVGAGTSGSRGLGVARLKLHEFLRVGTVPPCQAAEAAHAEAQRQQAGPPREDQHDHHGALGAVLELRKAASFALYDAEQEAIECGGLGDAVGDALGDDSERSAGTDGGHLGMLDSESVDAQRRRKQVELQQLIQAAEQVRGQRLRRGCSLFSRSHPLTPSLIRSVRARPPARNGAAERDEAHSLHHRAA